MAAGCSGVCKQFLLLLWKNFVLQIRRPIGTVAEILLPIGAVIFILGLRHGLFRREDRCFVTFDPDPLTPTNPVFNQSLALLPRVILFTPDNSTTRDIMELVSSKLPPDPFGVENILQGVENQTELLDGLENRDDDAAAGCFIGGAGIVFDLSDELNIRYTLRLRHEVGEQNTWFTRQISNPRVEPPGPRITDNFYLSEGFLHLENAVGLSIIQYLANQQNVPVPNVTVEMRQFPYPGYRSDIFLQIIGMTLPLLLMLAFIYTAGSFVKELVLEKETRIRESMFMMGLAQWILWASWYLKEFIFLLISIIVMTILIKGGQVFPESNGLLIFIFFLLFILSAISYCFLLSVFFNSARIGLLFGFVGWFVNYLPYFFVAPRFDEISTGGKIAACILSNTCLGLGVEVFARLENSQDGLQFSNVAEPLNLDDSFHMGYVYMMFIIDSIVYFVLAWYINGVKPGQYGIPKPLYFPFLPSYWTGTPRKSKIQEARDLAAADAGGYDPTAHEDEPTDLTVGITIENLTKIYGASWFSNLTSNLKSKEEQQRRKVAVNKLSLNMYKDQITALLGHNGAGKTTTMSILTGLFTPTSGSATINGLSILTDIDQIRHSLGICPQHNVLFNRLTVREHLRFFCRLKGVWNSETVRNEVESMIEDLQLFGKGDVPAGTLSGGQKRKLSVGIALIGGSEVVVLDEPTSGMDPYARRATWDLLVKHKPGRTMLLSTHFMDEADLLGDRIAIMADGQLKCSGSSLFLKSRYGIGYHMTVVKEPHCDSARVTEVVKSMITGARQVSDAGAELSFILPSASTPQFPALFDVMEARKTELAVSSFGVSVTTMEEVFIKVGEGTDETLDERVRRASIRSQGPTSPRPVAQAPAIATIPEDVTVHSGAPNEASAEIQVVDLTTPEEDVFLPGQPTASGATPLSGPPTEKPQVAETQFSLEESDERRQTDTATRLTGFQLPKDYAPNSGLNLWFQQFVAMFLKRFYNSLRFFAAVITQLLLPLVFVLFALILAKTIPNANENDEPRELRLNNSALSSNVTLFWAELQNPSGFDIDFANVTPESLGVSEFFNRTDPIQNIMMNDVQTGNNAQQCCSYEYQLLDKFCATRTESQLRSACGEDEENFGYTNCRDRCLSCCTAQEERLPSCTNPASQIGGDPNSEDFCPSSPRVSYEDARSGSPTGALDSEGTFVAEYLMRLADSREIDTTSFFLRYQAGFTVTTRDPPYAVCGCQTEELQTCQGAFQPLGERLNYTAEECPYYTALEECDSASPPAVCIMCEPASNISGCSTVDGIAANALQSISCNSCPQSRNSVGAIYPTPDQSPVAVTVWYNNQPWHMSAAALNGFHNILLQQTLNSSYTITVINHPQPRNTQAQIDTTTQNFTGLAIGTLVVFGYSFLIATFILFIVQEKESKAKHLQFVSGVHISSYWSATFAWDLLNAAIPVIVSLILFAAFQVDGYTGDGLGAVFLLFVFTAWASIPLTYVFSFLFKNYLTAFGIFFCFYYFSAVVMQTVVSLITNRDVADTLHYIFLTFPSYGLAIGLSDLFINNILRDVCTASPIAEVICANDDDTKFVNNALDFPRPGLGSILTYMAFEGIIFFMLAMLLEAKFFIPELKGFLISCKNGNNQEVDEEAHATDPLLLHGEDTDVFSERKRVLTGQTAENDVVIIKDLHKVYSKRLDGCTVRPAKAAVQGISLAIPSGECFGLLGVNGAGKTTTFSIITGDIPMTEGTASISGFDIRTNLRDAQQRVGYCPQFDALINRLTGRELLTMYGRLRGIPEHLLKDSVEAIIQRLDLTKHSDKQCGTYSGGNKRKLSTGIALVGNPSIVLLDEPSTGMDVDTRRHLWDMLTSVIREGRSIVLTSHSMEECEALCTRLAIMVNGRFKCLGSIQHLKNKYGAGFTLQAKVKLTAPPEPDPRERVTSSSSRFSLRRQGSRERSVSQSRDYTPISTPTHAAATPTSAASHRGYGRQVSGGDVFVFNPFDATALHNFIREAFPGAILLEEHQGAVGYQLPGTGITWSSIFRQIESNKERLGIVDYSVSQTTLDQVFINFAREQEDSEI